MSSIGERLREEVDRLGGIAATARGVGTATNTIYNWIEKGNIPANKLLELGALGADVTYVLTGQRMQPAVIEDGLSQQEKVIVQKLRMLDPQERDEIEDLVEKVEQAKTAKVRIEERLLKAGLNRPGFPGDCLR